MDTSLNPLAPLPIANAAPSPLPRAVTTRVQAIETADDAETLPANKPYVAPIISAQLSGTDFPDNPTEIAPSDRTLRPYDMPMLPSESHTDEATATGDEAQETLSVAGEEAPVNHL